MSVDETKAGPHNNRLVGPYERRAGQQQVTRIPPYRPGTWVKLKPIRPGRPAADLSGKVRQVKSLTCSITEPLQFRAVWRVHFEDGRCCEWHLVERFATPDEIQTAERRLRETA